MTRSSHSVRMGRSARQMSASESGIVTEVIVSLPLQRRNRRVESGAPSEREEPGSWLAGFGLDDDRREEARVGLVVDAHGKLSELVVPDLHPGDLKSSEA